MELYDLCVMCWFVTECSKSDWMKCLPSWEEITFVVTFLRSVSACSGAHTGRNMYKQNFPLSLQHAASGCSGICLWQIIYLSTLHIFLDSFPVGYYEYSRPSEGIQQAARWGFVHQAFAEELISNASCESSASVLLNVLHDQNWQYTQYFHNPTRLLP